MDQVAGHYSGDNSFFGVEKNLEYCRFYDFMRMRVKFLILNHPSFPVLYTLHDFAFWYL